MPEIDRGVAVAYCDSPGPLEKAPLPTFIAVSPAPADWPPERVASFYREYNRHMVHNLMVHEAMPGHYLQLQHSRRFGGSRTAIRAALRSGSFVEGWAVYAERVMAEQGYPGDGDPRAVRMQQLKMQLRTIINAILDASIHGHGMTEAEAMALMTGRGHRRRARRPASGGGRCSPPPSCPPTTSGTPKSPTWPRSGRGPRPGRPGGPQPRAGPRLAAGQAAAPVAHLLTGWRRSGWRRCGLAPPAFGGQGGAQGGGRFGGQDGGRGGSGDPPERPPFGQRPGGGDEQVDPGGQRREGGDDHGQEGQQPGQRAQSARRWRRLPGPGWRWRRLPGPAGRRRRGPHGHQPGQARRQPAQHGQQDEHAGEDQALRAEGAASLSQCAPSGTPSRSWPSSIFRLPPTCAERNSRYTTDSTGALEQQRPEAGRYAPALRWYRGVISRCSRSGCLP